MAQTVRVVAQTSLVQTERESSHASDTSLYTLLGYNLDSIYLYPGQYKSHIVSFYYFIMNPTVLTKLLRVRLADLSIQFSAYSSIQAK